jgi:hypothetical protein
VVDEEQIYRVCLWFCRLDVGFYSLNALELYWLFVIGFKSVEELYPSSPLGVDSADTSQLPKEKNLLGQL